MKRKCRRAGTGETTPDPLGSFDAIILGDLGPAEVPAELLGEARGVCRGAWGDACFQHRATELGVACSEETARKLLAGDRAAAGRRCGCRSGAGRSSRAAAGALCIRPAAKVSSEIPGQ